VWASLVVVAHVLSVFWLVGGVIGRDTCWGRAAHADELGSLETIAGLAAVFDRVMVRPATFVVLLTGLGAAWSRGWPILGLFQGGTANWVLAALLVYLSIIPVIVFVFLPRGLAYRKALEEAKARGTVTPELRATIRDPAVGAARGYEMAMITVLAWLMIAKPF